MTPPAGDAPLAGVQATSVVTAERFAQGMTFDQSVAYTGSPDNLAREAGWWLGTTRQKLGQGPKADPAESPNADTVNAFLNVKDGRPFRPCRPRSSRRSTSGSSSVR